MITSGLQLQTIVRQGRIKTHRGLKHLNDFGAQQQDVQIDDITFVSMTDDVYDTSA